MNSPKQTKLPRNRPIRVIYSVELHIRINEHQSYVFTKSNFDSMEQAHKCFRVAILCLNENMYEVRLWNLSTQTMLEKFYYEPKPSEFLSQVSGIPSKRT